jgi:parallel beta-helix repeat protein
MKRMTFVPMLGLMTLALGLFGISEVEAVSCGDTLGPGGSFTLTADLGPCGTFNALVVHGPTTVNLAGHTVSCNSGGSNGIEIIGSGAVVKNGRVTGCQNRGVDVQGSGGHQVRDVLADHNGFAFVIGSGRNALVNNGAVSNDGDGFIVQFGSNSNALTGNTAVNNFDSGFDLGGNSNSLSGNTAAHNAGNGFQLIGSSHNALHSNSAADNGGAGFALFSANSNSLGTNQAFANGSDGILIQDGSLNAVSGNVALGNPSYDLADSSGFCEGNSWSSNVFGTRNQACIH